MASATATSIASPSCASLDDSEESFVVLSKSLEPESLRSLNSIAYLSQMMQSQASNDSVQSVAGSLMNSSTVSELSSKEIQSKMESLLQENLELKETLHQNNVAMKKQFSTLVMWQEDVMKVHQSHKEKFEETKKLIANLRAENTELKKATSLPCSSGADDEVLNLKSKISALEFELDTLRQANIKYKIDLEKQLDENNTKYSGIEKKLEETLTEMAELEKTKNAEITALTEKNAVLMQHFEEKINIVVQLESKIKTLEDRVTAMIKEVDIKKVCLDEKTNLVDKLEKEVQELRLDNETIAILKTQVELYQTDFNQEREARCAIKDEKDRLMEDLKHLQRRNQQLIDENERLRENNFVHVSIPATSSSTTTRSSPESTPAFKCPVCESTFREYKFLEEHVEQCLQNS